jgi:uncharacterized membrane protein YeiH
VVHPEYLLYTTLCAFLTIFIAHSLSRVMKVFLVLDALGLSVFAIIGTQRVLEYGMSGTMAIIGGMLTGICGGMLRDILCNDIPLVLRRELYAVIALAGALLYIILNRLHLPEHINIIVTLIAIFTTRLLAIFFHIEMPKFDYAHKLSSHHKER